MSRRLLTVFVCLASLATTIADAAPWWKRGYSTRGVAGGTPQHQAPYEPGRSPYATRRTGREKYFMPPTRPRTPTWEMYGTPPGLVPGDFPSYAPLGMGGYRFPAVGNQAYR